MSKVTKKSKSTRGRPKKAVLKNEPSMKPTKLAGIPTFTEPTEHDLQDELSRLDSFAYSRYYN